jgi:hypothetical protein
MRDSAHGLKKNVTVQQGGKRITEQTEKTERTEPGQETFCLFRFFRLFRNPLRPHFSNYKKP